MFVKFPCYNISFSRLKAYRKNLFVKDISQIPFPHVLIVFVHLQVSEIKYSFTGSKNKLNHNDMHKQTLNKRKKKLL